MKFFVKDFFNKCDHIRSHLLKKSLMENFIFCAVKNGWLTKDFDTYFQQGPFSGILTIANLRREQDLNLPRTWV